MDGLTGITTMLEFVLIAVLHLEGDKLGPEMVIDIYPTQQLCIERASTARDIVARIEQEWYGYIHEEASHGHHVPPIKSIGMFCKPLGEKI